MCDKRTATRTGGSASEAASGHSTKQIASTKYGSRSPHSAEETPWKRKRSRWETSGFPRYRCPTVKVGLVTGTSIPRERQAPRTNVVLPAPSSPETVTTSPARRLRASRPATASVSAAESVIREKCRRTLGEARSEQAELNRRLGNQRSKHRLRLFDDPAEQRGKPGEV